MIDKLPPEMLLILAAVLGAIVHAFSRLESSGSPTWRYFIVYVTYGGFAGWMFGILAFWMFNEFAAQLFFTGMGAFTGFAGLKALAEWGYKKLGISHDK